MLSPATRGIRKVITHIVGGELDVQHTEQKDERRCGLPRTAQRKTSQSTCDCRRHITS